MTPPAGAPSGRVVAELGRPETPEETTARQAESSRLYRVRKTLSNLVWALLATVGATLAIVALVPRPDIQVDHTVDVTQKAADAQRGIPEKLAVPAVPSTWKANAANISRRSDGITEWRIAYLTPNANGAVTDYLGVVQGIHANPTWAAEILDRRKPTGSMTIGGQQWDVYDSRDRLPARGADFGYAMSRQIGADIVIVHGAGAPETVNEVAKGVQASLATPK